MHLATTISAQNLRACEDPTLFGQASHLLTSYGAVEASGCGCSGSLGTTTRQKMRERKQATTITSSMAIPSFVKRFKKLPSKPPSSIAALKSAPMLKEWKHRD